MSLENSYRQTLHYLYEHLPQFSQLGRRAHTNKLDNIISITETLGQPQTKYKTIHIAGTNGKGSTAHMLTAALLQAGYKVGMYTSPHLIDFRERIRINGQPISQQWVIDFVGQHKDLFEQAHPSYFEATVAMAFQAFADEKVDVAVIETGLGGRLDSTNIIQPDLCIITNISYDHKDILGDTLGKIAFEKAGIFKPNTPVVIGQSTDETEAVFFEKSLHTNSTLYYAANHWEIIKTHDDALYQYGKAVHLTNKELYDFKCDLSGSYQKDNIRTVLTACSILAAIGYKISTQHCLEGLAQVRTLTGIRGRWDRVSDQPIIIADVAHNPDGIQQVMQQWNSVQAQQKKIMVGFVQDKDVDEALQYFPKDEWLYCCQASIARAMPSDVLTQKAMALGYKARDMGKVEDAVKNVIQELKEDEALLIVGSFFVLGDALPLLDRYLMSEAIE